MAQQLQQLITKLDAPRRTLLMSKLSAVSSKRAAPLVLAWVASTLQKETLAMLQKDCPAAVYRDLVMSARRAKGTTSIGGDATASSDEHQLVSWMLSSQSLTWTLMLSMPRLEELIETLSRSNSKLDLAFRVLGLSNSVGDGELPSSLSGVVTGGPVSKSVRHEISNTLGSLGSESLALLMQAMGNEKGKPMPLDLLASAAAKYPKGPSSPPPEPVALAAVGLALERFIGTALGLYLQPDVQLITRLLRVSAFEVIGQQQGEGSPLSVITPDLLNAVVRQIVDDTAKASPSALSISTLLEDASAAAAAPGIYLGTWGSPQLAHALQSAAKADASGPASSLVACLSAWRRSAMLAGLPSIASTATAGELAAMSIPDRAMLRALADGMDATGKAMESLVLPGPSSRGNPVDLDTVRRARRHADMIKHCHHDQLRVN